MALNAALRRSTEQTPYQPTLSICVGYQWCEVTDIKTLKVGIVGLGIGEQHIIGYKSVPGCEVISVCDINQAKLKEVADRHRIARRYTDYRRITEDPTIDVVSICTYDDEHAEHTVSAFKHSKHVMVEKPVAINKSQADEVFHAYKKSGKVITSNLILRASPRFKWLKKRIAGGEMGDLFYLEGDYLHQIGHKVMEGWRGRISFYSPIFGGGIHLIDLITWLHPVPVVEVCAMGSQKVTGSRGNRFDDIDVLIMRFEDGTLAKVLVTLTPQHPKLHALRVFGTKASFVNALGDADWYDSDNPQSRRAVTVPYPAIEKGDLIPDFVAAIHEGRQPVVNHKDVFEVMEICLAAEESRANGVFVAPRKLM